MFGFMNNIGMFNWASLILSRFNTNGRGRGCLLFNKVTSIFYSIRRILYSAVEQQPLKNLYNIYFDFSLFEMNGLNIVKLTMRLTPDGVYTKVLKNFKCEVSK